MFCWKTALVTLLSLWLPLQGLAAVVMPFCQHSFAADPLDRTSVHGRHMNQDDMGKDHIDHSGMSHGAHHSKPSQQDSGDTRNLMSACDDCGSCNLSCAPTLPSTAMQAVALPLAAGPPYSFLPALAGVIPHRLDRPPLLA